MRSSKLYASIRERSRCLACNPRVQEHSASCLPEFKMPRGYQPLQDEDEVSLSSRPRWLRFEVDDTPNKCRLPKMVCILFLALALVVTSYCALIPKIHSESGHLKHSLRFESNGQFQIGIFEDLHFGESTLEARTTLKNEMI